MKGLLALLFHLTYWLALFMVIFVHAAVVLCSLALWYLGYFVIHMTLHQEHAFCSQYLCWFIKQHCNTFHSSWYRENRRIIGTEMGKYSKGHLGHLLPDSIKVVWSGTEENWNLLLCKIQMVFCLLVCFFNECF